MRDIDECVILVLLHILYFLFSGLYEMADSVSDRQHDLDLPLLSNIDDIRVKHYILELVCDDKKKILSGFINLVIDQDNATGCLNDKSNSVRTEMTPLSTSEIVERANMDRGGESTRLKEELKAAMLIEEALAITNQRVEIETSDKIGEMEVACKTAMLDTMQRTEEVERVIKMKEDKSATTISTVPKEKVKKAGLNEEGLAITNEKVVTEPTVNTTDRPTTKEDVVQVTEEDTYIERVDFDKVDRTLNLQLEISKNIKEDAGLPEACSICKPAEHDCHVKPEDNENDTRNISVGQLSETKDTFDQCYSTTSEDFVMILDACDLTIKAVQEITIQGKSSNAAESDSDKLRDIFVNGDKQPLEFCSEKACLKIWKSGTKCIEQFPRFIRISYQTQPCGSSLKWTRDQDGR